MGRFGFAKKHFKEGYRYIIYGCNTDRLSNPFVIRNANLEIQYTRDKDSFLDNDD